MRRQLALIVAAVAGLTAPASARAALTMSVQSGALTVTDDPGEAATVSVFKAAEPRYGITMLEAWDDNGATPLRAGPGCLRDGPRVLCPADGVATIALTLGDGDDVVAVGAAGIPARVDLGSGADRVSARGVTSLDVAGGAGDDDGTITPDIAAISFAGGDGDDTLTVDREEESTPRVTPVAGRITFSGGPGHDEFSAMYYAGTITASGGDGPDWLRAEASTGSARLDGGAGNDLLSLGSDDPDFPHPRGGHGVLLGGRGNDAFEAGPDGDRDDIDCGPGRDVLRFNDLMYPYPSLQNHYSDDCPPVGVKIRDGGSRRVHGRLYAVAKVTTPRRASIIAAVGHSPPQRKPAGRIVKTKLHVGVNRVLVRLTPRAQVFFVQHDGLPTTILAAAIGPGGDAIMVRGGPRFSLR